MTPPQGSNALLAESEKQPAVGQKGRANFSKTLERVEDFNKRKKSFRTFFAEIPRTAFIVFVVGLTLAVAGELLTEYMFQHEPFTLSGFGKKLLFALLKDAGIAISVSAIAVFGIEQWKKAKGDFDQKEMMEGMFVSLDATREKLQETETLQSSITRLSTLIETDLKQTLEVNNALAERMETIINHAIDLGTENAYKQCRAALALIFSPNVSEGGGAFSKSLEDLLEKAYDLQHVSANNRPDIQQYLRFLGWIIKQVPHPYAAAFSDFVSRDTGRFSADDIPSTRSIASEFVSSYVSLMKPGDEYWAISNILSWDAGEWAPFRRTIVQVCGQGVKSRRLFNLCSYVDKWKAKHLTVAEEEQARNKVNNHLLLQRGVASNYEIRFFGLDEVNKVTGQYEEMEHFRRMACGIFLREEGGVKKGQIVRAEDESVSTLIFERNIRDYQERFEKIWEVALQKNPFTPNGFWYGEKPGE